MKKSHACVQLILLVLLIAAAAAAEETTAGEASFVDELLHACGGDVTMTDATAPCSLSPTITCNQHNAITSLSITDGAVTCIPSSISLLTSLTSLTIGAKGVTSVPTSITELEKLEEFNADGSGLAYFPPVSMKQLRRVALQHNERLSVLTPVVGELTNLVSLRLTGNRLKDLPLSLNNLEKLEELDLSGNCLDCATLKATTELTDFIKDRCVQATQDASCVTLTPVNSSTVFKHALVARSAEATTTNKRALLTCDPNYYLYQTTSCQPCPAGTESAGGTVTGCSTCLAGTFRIAGTSAGCIPCSAGTSGSMCMTCAITTGACTQCQPNYGTESSICVQCPAGWQSDGTGACSQCLANTFKLASSTTGMCMPCNTGVGGTSCLYCAGGTGLCYTCYPGSALKNSTCYRCPAGADSNGLTDCRACAVGTFRLSDTYGCTSCSSGPGGPYCTQCSATTGLCSACTAGYSLVKGVCTVCPTATWSLGNSTCQPCSTGKGGPNCVHCYSTTGSCYYCKPNYGNVGGVCIGCAAGFWSDGLGVCSQAGQTYYRLPDAGSYFSCSSGPGGVRCSDCNILNGTCTRCLNGYGLTKDNFCTPCEAGTFSDGTTPCAPCSTGMGGPYCQTCAYTGYCTRCPVGMGIAAGECVFCPDGQYGPGTAACTDAPSQTYVLAGMTTYASCTTGVGGKTCLYCLSFSGECVQCSAESGLLNGTCYKCPAGKYSNGLTDCTTCVSGRFRPNTGGACIPCSSGPAGAGCLSCDAATGYCSQCTVGYGLINGVCSPCVAGTFTTNGTAPCDNCKVGLGGSHCVNCNPETGYCSQCEPGFGLDSGSCYQCPAGQYSAGKALCTSCTTGYFRWANTSACVSCSLGRGGPYCDNCNTMTGSCYHCSIGYGLTTNNFCSGCPSNSWSDGSSPCQSCTKGMGTAACLTCSGTQGYCSQCKPGYGLIYGTCEICPDGFQSAGTTACTACPAGTFRYNSKTLANGTVIPGTPGSVCVACSSGIGGSLCATCNARTGECQSCVDATGYYLQTKSCLACPAGTYSDGTQPCTACASGYYRFTTDAACKACSVGPGGASCSRCNPQTGVCTKCVAGAGNYNGYCIPCPTTTFNVNGTGACVPCGQGNGGSECNYCTATTGNCVYCNPTYGVVNGVCTKCEKGYYSGGTVPCDDCPNGYYRLSDTGACVACSLGPGGSGCTNCFPKNGTCTRCSNGWGFNYSAWGAVCMQCLSNSFSDGTSPCAYCGTGAGKESAMYCSSPNGLGTRCLPGHGWTTEWWDYWGTYLHSGICMDCLAGTYSPGTIACRVCPAATWSAPTATSCRSCADGPGTFACTSCNVGNGICTVCQDGYGLYNATCIRCPYGTWSTGTAPCAPASTGYWTPAGTYTQSPCSTGSSGSSCAECDGATGVCKRCNAGTSLVNRICTACPSGTYSNGTTKCFICASVGGTGCVTCNAGSGACTSCRPGYGLLNGKCTACTAGMYSTGTTACTACATGYFRLANTTACTPCSSGPGGLTCSTCEVTTGVCTGCSAGSGFYNGYCRACTTGYFSEGSRVCTLCSQGIGGSACQQCAANTGMCSKCTAGSGLSNGLCTACVVGTWSTGTVACTNCDDGYYRTATDTGCVACSSGSNAHKWCAKCVLTTGLCTSCNAGYGYENGTCTACPAGTYSSGTTKCLACPSGSYRWTGTGDCVPCSSGPGGATCQICDAATGACSLCNPGSGLGLSGKDTVCSTCSAGTFSYGSLPCLPCRNATGPACLTCDARTTSCTACVPGYGLVNGICTACPAGTYSSGTAACTPCNNGYYRRAATGDCVACTSGPGGANCLSCSADNGLCTKCSAGYGAYNGVCRFCLDGTFSTGGTQCLPCIAGSGGSPCLACSSTTGTCSQCSPGYALVSGTCALCPKGTWGPGTGLCSACTVTDAGTKCTTCDAFNGTCSACVAGYGVLSGLCAACSAGTFNLGGSSCKKCQNGPGGLACRACSTTTGLCTKCAAGYGLLNGVCTLCASGTWSLGLTGCSLCSSGSGGSACTICSNSNGTCTKCSSGYGLVKGVCYSCAVGSYSDGSGACSGCPTGTFRNSATGMCISCSFGSGGSACQTCNPSSGFCTKCSIGNGLVSGACTPCPTGSYSLGDSACSTCSTGAGGVASLLCSSTTGGATQCVAGSGLYNGVCQTCSEGTYSDGTTVCSSCPAGFYKVSGAATCAACSKGPGGPLCSICDFETGLCTLCNDATGLVNGVCTSCPENTYSDGSTACKACTEDKFSDGTTPCTSCGNGQAGANCLTCTGATGVCTKCSVGYGLYDGTCQKCPAGSYSDGLTSCIYCSSDSFTTDSTVKCASCSTGAGGKACLTCDVATGACSKCSAGYGIRDGICVPCIGYTWSAGATACQACSSGGGDCTACSAVNGRCTACKAGSYLDTTTDVCTRCDAGTYSLGTAACRNCPFQNGCTACKQDTGYCTVCPTALVPSGYGCGHPIYNETVILQFVSASKETVTAALPTLKTQIATAMALPASWVALTMPETTAAVTANVIVSGASRSEAQKNAALFIKLFGNGTFTKTVLGTGTTASVKSNSISSSNTADSTSGNTWIITVIVVVIVVIAVVLIAIVGMIILVKVAVKRAEHSRGVYRRPPTASTKQ